jgi:hypothetical protein
MQQEKEYIFLMRIWTVDGRCEINGTTFTIFEGEKKLTRTSLRVSRLASLASSFGVFLGLNQVVMMEYIIYYTLCSRDEKIK